MCLKRPCVVAARLRRQLQHFKNASAAKALPYTNLALAAVTLSGMTYDRDAAPPSETTSTHVARKLLAHAAATLCAFFVLQSLSTRCLKPSLLTASRLAIKSRRSIATRARLSQDQNFSIGFRSGDLGGILHSSILEAACAAWLAGALRKASLSASTRHGPDRRVGRRLNMAALSLPDRTA